MSMDNIILKIFAYESPIGKLTIAEQEGKLRGIWLTGELKLMPETEITIIKEETPLIAETHRQLEEYFAGKRQAFDLPLLPQGTDFQQRVWQELYKIPYGETVSYGEIAKRIGDPKAARAVGMANNKNPWLIVVPCHRVIGADGSLVGYGGGSSIKSFLLELEKKNFAKKEQ